MEVIICPDADAVAQLAAAKVERVARDPEDEAELAALQAPPGP